MRNTLCTLEMLANTYWRDRQSHFLMQSTPELRACQQATEALMSELALMLKSGELQGSELAISRLQEAMVECGSTPAARPPSAAICGSTCSSPNSSPICAGC